MHLANKVMYKDIIHELHADSFEGGHQQFLENQRILTAC